MRDNHQTHPKTPAWLDPLILALVWAAACTPFLTGNRYIGGDSTGEFYAQASFVIHALLHGQAPWWNPFEYGGLPVLADPQSLLFTPHILVGLIAGPAFNLHIFDLTTVACPLIGALALRRYTAAYSDTRILPLLGATVFMLGGVATSRLQHVPQIVSYSLLPLQLLAARAVCRAPTARATATLTLTLLAALLNLNQVTFLSAFALLPFVASHLVRSPCPPRAALHLAAAALAALLVAAPALSALAEFLPLSNRAAYSVDASTGFSFPLLNLASLLLPGLFGVTTPQNGFWPPTDISQDYLYIGVIPCVVLLLALWRAPRAPWPTPLFALMAAFWFIFAMGTRTPLYPILFAHIPGFAAFRRPADGAFLMNFSIALAIGGCRADWLPRPATRIALPQVAIALTIAAVATAAAIGLHDFARLTGHAAELPPIVGEVLLHSLVIAGALAVLLASRVPGLRALVAPVVLIAAVGELLSAGRFGPVLTTAYADNAVAELYGRSREQAFFIAEIEQTLTFLRAQGADAANPMRIEVLGGALSGTVPLALRIAVTEGYNPMLPGVYARIVGNENLSSMARVFTAAAPFYDSPIFHLLGVRYVLMDKYASGPILDAIRGIKARLAAAPWATPLGMVGAYDIWQLRDAAPKATLHADSIMPLPAAIGACTMRRYRNIKLSVECHSATAATLVIGDGYAPGWTACVNGAPREVYRYADLFRAVHLDAGDSAIVMRYQPIPFLRTKYCKP